MRSRIVRVLVSAAVVVAAAGLPAAASAADPGPGTFTRITSPKTMIYKYDGLHPAANTFIVSGVTSADVTSVNIVCVFYDGNGPEGDTFASAVPVTAGSFSTTALFPRLTTNCRLRAVPSGADTSDYLGSYSGPILYTNAFLTSAAGGVTYGYLAIGEQGDGIAAAYDAGTCGASILTTVQTPSMTAAGDTTQECAFSLPPTNITSAGPTGSAITVDGHNAYLPAGVNSYLIGSQSLAVTQSKLATTFSRAENGDLTVTESAVLVRCSVADTFPPTTASCPKLVSTGVTFKRTVNLFRGDHQIRMRDTFTSTGAAHSVKLQYVQNVPRADTGSPGFVYPGHSSDAVGATSGQAVTGFGKTAASLLVRSDRYAAVDEPEADTHALTWSRPPSKIQFSAPVRTFGMSYSLDIPKRGAAYLGFADSESATTAGVGKLARQALGDVMVAPTISSPKTGASVKGKSTTVKGFVSVGANGLPRSVSVNGHRAKLTAATATRSTWAVTFNESLARHTITAIAADAAGNTSTSAIKVTNKR